MTNRQDLKEFIQTRKGKPPTQGEILIAKGLLTIAAVLSLYTNQVSAGAVGAVEEYRNDIDKAERS